jgi:hypothetical protein
LLLYKYKVKKNKNEVKTMFDFNRDYEAELINNTEWVWQTFQAIEVLQANNCYPDLGAGASHGWGRMNVEVANWTKENYELINHLEVNYKWLTDRYPTHPLTQAIAGYIGKAWFFLQMQQNKIEEVKEVEQVEEVKKELTLDNLEGYGKFFQESSMFDTRTAKEKAKEEADWWATCGL